MKELGQETVIRQYLLGELDDDGRQLVEQRLITDRDYKEEVLIIEEELLEDFVAGALPERERELFLRNYLSAPLQRQKLRIAQALDKYAAERPPLTAPKIAEENRLRKLLNIFRSRKWFVQLSWAVMALVVLGGSWLAFQAWRSGTQQAELQAELARLNGPQSDVLEANASVSQAQLTPISLRARGSIATVTITPQTQVVQLRIPGLASQYQSYRATLKDSRGAEVLRVDGLTARTVGNIRMLVLQIPPRVLRMDDYMLTTSGLNSAGAFEETGDYSFRVLMRNTNPIATEDEKD